MHPSESAHNVYSLHNLNKVFQVIYLWPSANGQYISKSRLQLGSCTPNNIQLQFDTLQERSQDRPDKCYDDAQINGMHGISHQHLMHAKVVDQPESVEDKMSASNLPHCLVVH